MKRGRNKNQTVEGEGAAQAIPSTGQVNGRKRGRPKQAEENPTLGIDNTEPTENLNSSVSALEEMLRSTVPIIVEEIMRKIQDERRVSEENLESSRKLIREDEVREWKYRKKCIRTSIRTSLEQKFNARVCFWFTKLKEYEMKCGRKKNPTVVKEGATEAIPSTGQVDGRRRGRSKQAEENSTMGVDLNPQPTDISSSLLLSTDEEEKRRMFGKRDSRRLGTVDRIFGYHFYSK
ncbi:hypothetical protein L6452_15908 [Arctium lappa]|uniref:Uncharacterized protein n=1 Tax=Arctium lappa TaxID=4217 RepID=A0ACB9CPZ6_ARCLA|nr:hypothetical protein L6452_15908 [Arctium lappa]